MKTEWICRTQRTSGLLLATILMTFALPPAQAVPLTFFGEDLNFTNDPDTAVDDPLRPTSLPNSTAARTAFLAHLIGVSTEDFEGFAEGTIPSSLSDLKACGARIDHPESNLHTF